MQFPKPLIALSVGAIIALSSAEVAQSGTDRFPATPSDRDWRGQDATEPEDIENHFEAIPASSVQPLRPAEGETSLRLSQSQSEQESAEPDAVEVEATEGNAATTVDVEEESQTVSPEDQSNSVELERQTENESTSAVQTEGAEGEVESSEVEAIDSEPESSATAEDEAAETTEATTLEENQSETAVRDALEQEAIESESPAPTSPAPTDSQSPTETAPTETAPTPNSANADDEPVPDYLYPPANPLTFPTRPEEVELVGTQPITLEQALELSRNTDGRIIPFRGSNFSEILRIEQLQLEQARAALREQRAARLPTIDASTGFQVDENDLSENLEGEFEGDDATSSLSGTLRIDYDIYTSGLRRSRIQEAEARVRLQELEVERVVEELRLEVTRNYYDLQETDERVRIARATVAQGEQSLRDAQALERAGVGTRFDVLSAETDLAGFRQDLAQAINDQQTARRRLAIQLGISQTVNLVAADPVEVADQWPLTLEETIIESFQNRADLQQELLQRDIADQQRRQALAVNRPQVSAFATYGVQNNLTGTGSNGITPVLTDEQTDWRDNYSLGLQVTLRLFDGGAARARADQEEAEIAIAETNFAARRDEIRFEVEQAYFDLQSNFENIQTATLGVQTAREALRLARLRFQAGVGTQIEVLRQQTELAQAELDQVTAILDYNRALISLERSVSNYPDGVLFDVP